VFAADAGLDARPGRIVLLRGDLDELADAGLHLKSASVPLQKIIRRAYTFLTLLPRKTKSVNESRHDGQRIKMPLFNAPRLEPPDDAPSLSPGQRPAPAQKRRAAAA
jgi:hypothetical protein